VQETGKGTRVKHKKIKLVVIFHILSVVDLGLNFGGVVEWGTKVKK